MEKSFLSKLYIKSLLWAIGIWLIACKTAAPSTTSSGSFQDDLSVFRPTFKIEVKEEKTDSQEPVVIAYPEPINAVNARLTSYLDTLASNNKKVKYIDGYTILVYTGTNRDMAMQAKNDAYKLASKHRPDIQFKQPTYRVKVGRFADRLEAQKVYAKLRLQFENAIIIPEKVALQ
jgi:hypothetical protein